MKFSISSVKSDSARAAVAAVLAVDGPGQFLAAHDGASYRTVYDGASYRTVYDVVYDAHCHPDLKSGVPPNRSVAEDLDWIAGVLHGAHRHRDLKSGVSPNRSVAEELDWNADRHRDLESGVSPLRIKVTVSSVAEDIHM